MQIHELPSGTPTDSDLLPFDTGSVNYKTPFSGFDVGENTATFTSADEADPQIFKTVGLIETGPIKTILNRLSMVASNVRYIWKMIGSTNISGIADGTITGAINNVGSFKCVSMSIGYQAGESILSVVQRAYAETNMPKGVPFIALVGSGAYYTLQGYWYTGQETGYCIVSLYNHSYYVSLTGGVWAIYELDRSMDLAAGYLSTSTSLTTSLAIIPMGEDYFLRGCFTRTSDGGYKASKRLACVVSASGHVASATTGDTLVFSIGRYKGEWTFTGQSFMAAGTTTDRSFSIPQYPMVVDENEIVYLRGRNATAARGSVDSARLLIQPVY